MGRRSQPVKTEEVTFDNRDGQSLSAAIDVPVGRPPAAWVLFAHCFTCSKNLPAIRNISRALTGAGLGVLRFDFTGLGESEGAFEETNFSSNIHDLHDAAAYLESRADAEAPALLLGHSLGGAAVLAAAGDMPSVKAVVTVAAPAHPEHVTRMFEGSAEEIERTGEATVKLAGRPFKIRKQLIDDLAQRNHRDQIGKLRRALLVFHSPVDELVGIDNARQIYEAARHPKSFITLDGADHLVRDPRDATYVGTMVAAWARRYLPQLEARTHEASEASARPGHPQGATAQVVVRTGAEGYLSDIEASGHGLVSDEPESLGGTGAGPGPYDLLLAALGACTGMTLRMYADRKGFPVDAIEVHLDHDKVHLEDCEACTDDTRTEIKGKIDRIDRRIVLRGNLDDEQRGRLMKIADKCPVHRTLHSDVWVESQLVTDGEAPDGRPG